MMDKNYGVFHILAPLGILAIGAVLAIGLPLLIGGSAVAIKIVQVLFFAPKAAGIPVWAIFAVAIMVIFLMRRR